MHTAWPRQLWTRRRSPRGFFYFTQDGDQKLPFFTRINVLGYIFWKNTKKHQKETALCTLQIYSSYSILILPLLLLVLCRKGRTQQQSRYYFALHFFLLSLYSTKYYIYIKDGVVAVRWQKKKNIPRTSGWWCWCRRVTFWGGATFLWRGGLTPPRYIAAVHNTCSQQRSTTTTVLLLLYCSM